MIILRHLFRLKTLATKALKTSLTKVMTIDKYNLEIERMTD
jgi:hypothetical protein